MEKLIRAKAFWCTLGKKNTKTFANLMRPVV